MAITHSPTPSVLTEETHDHLDLFSDHVDPASVSIQATRRRQADEARRAKLAQLPPPSQRSCAQSRSAYVLSGRRLQPTTTAHVFTPHECDRVIAAVVAYADSQGALHTHRHQAFATTDVPVAHLTLPWIQHPSSEDDAAATATGCAARQMVVERVLEPLAKATGFQPRHLGLKDLFVVCYRAGQSTADQQLKQHPIPSKQASLALHSDGCLLSFSLLLNHQSAFQGGGTFFKASAQTFHVEQGGLLVHDAGLEHAGAEVTSGQRIMLVGFVETVDVLKEKLLWERQSTHRPPHRQAAS